MLAFLSGRGRARVPGRARAHFGAEWAGQVVAAEDDGHEVLSSGVVVLDDGVLRLGAHQSDFVPPNASLLTGVRLVDVPISQGETIDQAFVRFVARNGNTYEVILRIRAELTGNASAFTTANGNLSGRALTTAYVDWTVPVWAGYQDDAGTITPDISSVLQEVVNQPGWASGNALALLFEFSPLHTNTDSPRRRAWSFVDSPADAARLTVGDAPVTPGDPGDPGDPSDPEDPPEVPLEAWGSYTVNPSFSNAALPSPVKPFDSDCVTAWENVCTSTSGISGYSGTVLDYANHRNMREAGRNVLPLAHATATACWLTGNPAYLTHVQTAANSMANRMTLTEPLGGQIYDIQYFAHPTNWSAMSLDEPITYAVYAIYLRLLHENGLALPPNGLLRLQESWRRWHSDKWNWNPDSNNGNVKSGASLTHDDPALPVDTRIDTKPQNLKWFMHTMSSLAVTAHTLHHLTGNNNYAVGRDKILGWLGRGSGAEVGSNPPRASWVHRPDSDVPGEDVHATLEQRRTYARYTVANLAHIGFEVATIFPMEDLKQGIEHFLFRDADTVGVRSGMAGSLGSAGGGPPAVIVPYTPGGFYVDGGTMDVLANTSAHGPEALSGWTRFYQIAATRSSIVRAQSTANKNGNASHYWNHMGAPTGLLWHAYDSL